MSFRSRLDVAEERIGELRMARVNYSEKKGWKMQKGSGKSKGHGEMQLC